MNTKKQKIDEIVALAKQTAHYSDLLARQCNRWTSSGWNVFLKTKIKRKTKWRIQKNNPE